MNDTSTPKMDTTKTVFKALVVWECESWRIVATENGSALEHSSCPDALGQPQWERREGPALNDLVRNLCETFLKAKGITRT